MVIGITRRVAALGHPNDDRGLGHTMMELSPSWFRLLAAPSAGALALVAWLSSVTADSRGIPADLPIGELKTLRRDWQPDDCTRSEREQIICTIEAFFVCNDFFRKDLCERVGLYPSLVPEQEYVLFIGRIVEGEFVLPDLRQYRLLEFRSLDERYSPPILLVHVEMRYCWHIARRPVSCSVWGQEYEIISSLDTAQPNVAAWGVVHTPP